MRFQGGSNAGHTIINKYGKFALHLLPSGVFYGHTTSIIGNGVALNIPYLCKEIKSLVERGVPEPKILVSDRAQIMMPYHILFDEYEEERLGKQSFGSTKSGIAPFYSDKYAKIGFQVSELFDEVLLEEKVKRVLEQKNILLEMKGKFPVFVNDGMSGIASPLETHNNIRGLTEHIRDLPLAFIPPVCSYYRSYHKILHSENV